VDEAPLIDKLKYFPISDIRPWLDKYAAGEYVCASDVNTMTYSPAAAKTMAAAGIKSTVNMPLQSTGFIYGFIAIDDCKTNRVWKQSQLDLLKNLSQIVSTAISRNHAESSISRSQQMMQAVLNDIDNEIWVIDVDTSEVLFGNRKVKNKAGCETVEGKKCWEAKVDQKHVCEFCPRQRLFDYGHYSGRPYKWETFNEKDGRWYEEVSTLIEWIDGRTVQLENCIDITSRKIIESKIVVQQARLEDLSKRQAVLINILQLMQSCDNLTQSINTAIAEIGKYTGASHLHVFEINAEEKIYNCTHEWDNTGEFSIIDKLEKIPIEDIEPWFEMYESGKLVSASDISSMTYSPEVMRKMTAVGIKSVVTMPLLVNDVIYGFIALNECNEYREWEKNEIALLKSISQIISNAISRHQTKLALISAKDKAEESDRLKSSFLANMSHEIRTPLNAILGFVNILNERSLSPETLQNCVLQINGASKNLMKLIHEIIDIAKIESEQMEIYPAPVNVNDLMRELKTNTESIIQARNRSHIEIMLKDDDFIDSCQVIADGRRLFQVLDDLLENAVKFTEKGFVSFGYRLTSNNMLEFFVEDTGIGMSSEQQELVFERFRQVELGNTRRYGGTGLGLSIARGLVRIMVGELWVKSTEGIGSSFYFTLPYYV
jgi:signal transduction histidine kinase/PAS domain-containing protein